MEHGGYMIFLYHGMSEQDYRDDSGSSELQLFGMNGDARIRIQLPVIATSFHIDNGGRLYLFNPLGESEYIYRYDLSYILGSAS